MKKVIFAVLALIFAMALVTCGYFLITSLSLQKYSVDEDVPCPYSWQELRSGAYRLEIDTSAYPDHSWRVECYPKNVITAAKADSDPGTAVFSILPLNMGQAYVRVYCEQTSPLTVCVFEIGMQVIVSEKLSITVETTEHTTYDGITTMDKDEENPIHWWTNTNGTVNLLIDEKINGNWVAVDYDADCISVAGPFYREGSCGFEIQGKKSGTFSLIISDSISKAFLLELNVNGDLTTSITSLEVGSYTSNAGGAQAAPQSTAYSSKANGGSASSLLNAYRFSDGAGQREAPLANTLSITGQIVEANHG